MFSIPTNWIIENYGVHKSICISAVITIIGLWIRVFINYSFYYVIAGNFIAAMGRAFATNAPPKVSLHWFFPENRALVTSIMLLCVSSGIVIGWGITICFVDTSTVLSVV